MLNRISLLSLLALIWGCGPDSPIESTLDIGGGISIEAKEYPAVVKIKFGQNQCNGLGICTGFFLRPDVLMTAAHCVPSASFKGYIKVEGGTGTGCHKIQKLSSIPGAVARLRYQNKNGTTNLNSASKDIALVYLQQPVARQTIGMTMDDAERGDQVTMVGFGRTTLRNRMSGKKHKGFNDLTNVQRDYLTFGSNGGSNGRDSVALPGDSGGPLILKDGVIGVTSVLSRRSTYINGYAYLKGRYISRFLEEENIDRLDYPMFEQTFALQKRREFMHPGEIKFRVLKVPVSGIINLTLDDVEDMNRQTRERKTGAADLSFHLALKEWSAKSARAIKSKRPIWKKSGTKGGRWIITNLKPGLHVLVIKATDRSARGFFRISK